VNVRFDCRTLRATGPIAPTEEGGGGRPGGLPQTSFSRGFLCRFGAMFRPATTLSVPWRENSAGPEPRPPIPRRCRCGDGGIGFCFLRHVPTSPSGFRRRRNARLRFALCEEEISFHRIHRKPRAGVNRTGGNSVTNMRSVWKVELDNRFPSMRWYQRSPGSTGLLSTEARFTLCCRAEGRRVCPVKHGSVVSSSRSARPPHAGP